MRRPRWSRNRGLSTSNHPARRGDSAFRVTNLAIALSSAIVALVALIFSVHAFQQSELDSGPIVALAADASFREETTQSVAGTVVNSHEFSYGLLVLTNRGRSQVDVLDARPIGLNGSAMKSQLFTAASCEKPGHVTLAPGASIALVLLYDFTKAPQKYKILLATGTRYLSAERERYPTDAQPQILKSYTADARAIVERCIPGALSS